MTQTTAKPRPIASWTDLTWYDAGIFLCGALVGASVLRLCEVLS